LNGDLAASAHFIDMLTADSGIRLVGHHRATGHVHPVIGKDGLVARGLWGECFQGMLHLERGWNLQRSEAGIRHMPARIRQILRSGLPYTELVF